MTKYCSYQKLAMSDDAHQPIIVKALLGDKFCSVKEKIVNRFGSFFLLNLKNGVLTLGADMKGVI